MDEQIEDLGDDRISQLPDEVLCLIMCFLRVADAFALKGLSRRWRRLQVPLTSLHINPYTMFGTPLPPCYSKSKIQDKLEFVQRVDWFLNSYRAGPYPINSFSVCFGGLDNELASSIDNWVSFAVTTLQVESIELNFYEYNFGTAATSEYKFPFHQLLSGKTSHLSLSSCFLLFPPQSPLNSLKTLNLQRLSLDQTGLDSVLSSCSQLEWLSFKKCNLPRTVRVSSSSNTGLKGLSFLFCLDTFNIELSSSVVDKLKVFEYSGRVSKLPFRVVPHLQRVLVGFLNPLEGGTQYIFNRLPNELPEIQFLSLLWYAAKAWPIPASVSRFSCLKELDFFVWKYRGFDLLSITHLLNACPMLHKFKLALQAFSGEVVCKQREKVVYSKDTVYLHLEEIQVCGFRGTPEEMELVIYLLNTCVALKRMTLIYSRQRTYDSEWRDVECGSWCEFLTEENFLDLLRNEMISHGAELIIR